MARKLGQKQIDDFKNAFLEQIKNICNQYADKRQDAHGEVDFDGDEVDVVQGVLISSIQEKLSSRDSNKLKKIRNALMRIEEGTFGECQECEGQIGKPRLLARPEAELCIDCAEKAEKEEKHYVKRL